MSAGPPLAAPPAQLPGANEPCWCGSGLKYKKCHRGADAVARPQSAAPRRVLPGKVAIVVDKSDFTLTATVDGRVYLAYFVPTGWNPTSVMLKPVRLRPVAYRDCSTRIGREALHVWCVRLSPQ